MCGWFSTGHLSIHHSKVLKRGLTGLPCGPVAKTAHCQCTIRSAVRKLGPTCHCLPTPVIPQIAACQAPLSMDFPGNSTEWPAIAFFRGSSQPRDGTCISGLAGGWSLYHWPPGTLDPTLQLKSHTPGGISKIHVPQLKPGAAR